jgi:hypothetical protein
MFRFEAKHAKLAIFATRFARVRMVLRGSCKRN